MFEAIGLQRVQGSGGPPPPLEKDESVLQTFQRVQLVIGAAADQGEGTIFILEGRIVWLNGEQRGYAFGFPSVAMHAVVADDESANRPCLYLQLDNGEEEEEGGFGGSGSGSGSDDEGAEAAEAHEGEANGGGGELTPELRLVPADGAQLDALFQAFCEGAERNPDSSEGEGDEEGEGFFYDQDAALAGMAGTALGVEDVEELVGDDDARFADA